MPADRGPTALYCSRKCRDAQYRVTYAVQRKANIERWREENAEHVLQYSRDYYAEHTEQIAERSAAAYAADPTKQRATSTAWKLNNAQRQRQYYKVRYENNPEHYRLLAREYAIENPVVRAQRQRLRKARMSPNAPGNIMFTEREWAKVLIRFEGRCAYCRQPLPQVPGQITMDHIIPLSRGGRHALPNIVPACVACNSSKHNKYLAEWRHSGLAPEGPFLA